MRGIFPYIVFLLIFQSVSFAAGGDAPPMTCQAIFSHWKTEAEEAAKGNTDFPKEVIQTAQKHTEPEEKAVSIAKPHIARHLYRKARQALIRFLVNRNNHKYAVVDTDLFLSARKFANQFFDAPENSKESETGEQEQPKPLLAELPPALEKVKTTLQSLIKSPIKIKPAEPASLDPEVVYKQLNDRCETVENFLPRLHKYLDGRFDQELKIAQLESIYKAAKKSKTKGPITAKYPEVTRENGKLVIQTKFDRWNDLTYLKSTLRELKEKREEYDQALWDLGRDQALAIKALETYQQEIRKAQVQRKTSEEDPGPEPKGRYKVLWDRINELFVENPDSPGHYKVKPEYEAPLADWDAIQNTELWNELRSLAIKDSKLFEKLFGKQSEDIRKVLSDMDEEDIKAAGFDKPSDGKIPFWATYRWGRMWGLLKLPALLGAGGGAIANFPEIKEIFLSDAKARQRCAEMKEKDYYKCVEEYVQKYFPGELKAGGADMSKLFSSTDQITDPDLKAAILDIRDRRDKFMREQLGRELVLSQIRNKLSSDNLYEDTGRTNTIQIRDESAFEKRLLDDEFTDPSDGKSRMGYLQLRYGGVYALPSVRALVARAVQDPKTRSQALSELRKIGGAQDLADDLQKLLEERNKFLKTGS